MNKKYIRLYNYESKYLDCFLDLLGVAVVRSLEFVREGGFLGVSGSVEVALEAALLL